MNLSKIWLKIIAGLLLILGAISCSVESKTVDVVYLIPDQFEGAVIVIYDQKDGVSPQIDEKSYILTVPKDGIVRVNLGKKDLDGFPKFIYVDDSGSKNEIEFLSRRKISDESNIRTEETISDDERENKVFVMNYDVNNFNTASDRIFIRSFLICKVKDGNLFASRDLPKKITDVQKTFSVEKRER